MDDAIEAVTLRTGTDHSAGGKWRLLCIGLAMMWIAPQVAVAQFGGISIDAEGLVQPETMVRETSAAARRRAEAFAQEHLGKGVVVRSEARCLSLRGLEAELRAAGSVAAMPVEALHCYGLQRIETIILDVEGQDLLLCGPAEGFAPDSTGRMRGVSTGRPPLRAEDLLTALRWGRDGREQIGCSIDPVPERMAEMQNYMRNLGQASSNQEAHGRNHEMARILGRQIVSVYGVDADTHFGQVLVEADYRMKLIALGKENPGVRGLRSQISLATPQGNSLQRWWFIPLYEPITVNADRTAYGLAGQRAQLLAQEQWSDMAGNRRDAPFTRLSTEKFAELFTEHFGELAEESAVFAELQSVFDLAVLAELARREDFTQRIRWDFGELVNAAKYPLPVHPVPREIDSLATSVVKSRFVIGLIGGVSLDAAAVARAEFANDTSGALERRVAAVTQAAVQPSTAVSAEPVRWFDPQGLDTSESR
ncbi:MAG: DUF1598 domain-containing protein [Planctomycetaceae bacterium]